PSRSRAQPRPLRPGPAPPPGGHRRRPACRTVWTAAVAVLLPLLSPLLHLIDEPVEKSRPLFLRKSDILLHALTLLFTKQGAPFVRRELPGLLAKLVPQLPALFGRQVAAGLAGKLVAQLRSSSQMAVGPAMPGRLGPEPSQQ